MHSYYIDQIDKIEIIHDDPMVVTFLLISKEEEIHCLAIDNMISREISCLRKKQIRVCGCRNQLKQLILEKYEII
ncbi:hypothetical protein [Enterococcus raffinosus]|uniref:Uncharacterized protein n=1 Tax=Enterococcus raffinosus TaxID=71452 RepID=A0AAW8T416_9ENTE|nr:hypothetical protein [Enterococcus raffinosus]MDT2521997.1 hypothetical protein [Enterococcus raffinosus]MDT2528341.1 hypothetical protein [Enterococcus raffinosus]MDT2533193.1 hypothetical protein [Enterococcus raffinosus]MDT2543633.1 hypothetical protein [Enterococcus raffinosus]MDT2553747.1 hypothetical protein [Enterococcus raffinosus]